MRRLFLIRHAKAQPSIGSSDYERTLTDRGRKDARRVAAALAGRRVLPDVLVHSGAARAKETAEIFAGAWLRGVELQEDPALYDATQTTLFACVRALPELRHLAAKYPTGAVAVLDFSVRCWEDVERNSAMLALYLTPAELEAGAD